MLTYFKKINAAKKDREKVESEYKQSITDAHKIFDDIGCDYDPSDKPKPNGKCGHPQCPRPIKQQGN